MHVRVNAIFVGVENLDFKHLKHMRTVLLTARIAVGNDMCGDAENAG